MIEFSCECELCHNTYPKTAIITMIDNIGSLRACHNCLYKAIKNDLLALEEIPELECELSKELGAVIYTGYRNPETEKTERYILNPESMKRLLTYSLNRQEHFKLYVRHGYQFMLHQDCYSDFMDNYC